ncbi:sulfate transporter CysZ [Aliikangiella sp. G2MR2-5]|uniref:sulfate transporter CysZ n=1 Tax=Aliikangiella sp. G2MR2-5 TaxID=2788943 RepID=UPI0018AA67C7|nr:sulfate transporter CysZ [Aliikangiella sp. G2MR2-5]
MTNNAFSGAHYLSNGFRLILKPGIRSFVLIPLTINLILLSAASLWAFNMIGDWFAGLKQSEYSWVQWTVENLEWLIWPLIVIGVVIVVFFIFAFIANWIAAPFNGLLAEAVEKNLRGENYKTDSFSWKNFFADIPRLFGREWRKLVYFLPRAIGCLLLFLLTFWTPFFFISPIVWFFFNSWMAAIQYIDYPMDNHRIPFSAMLDQIKERRSGSMGFGCMVMLLTMIPGLNILVMPAAVAGATNLWVDHYPRPNMN